MNKITLILFLLISNLINSQNFPGESVDLLLNKMVKPKEIKSNLQKYSYRNFYSKFDIKNPKLDNKYRLLSKDGIRSDYDKLVGVPFKVSKIHDIETNIKKQYILELTNDQFGTIYYQYDSKFEHDFELTVIDGLILNENFYCNEIKVTTDKFTNEIKSTTEYTEGCLLLKVLKNNDSKIYMKINQPGTTFNLGKKGLILLLENNKKIERPQEDIDVKINGKNYVYSAFIELTKSEIDLIIQNPIISKRLYVYDDDMEYGKKISEYLKCLIKSE